MASSPFKLSRCTKACIIVVFRVDFLGTVVPLKKCDLLFDDIILKLVLLILKIYLQALSFLCISLYAYSCSLLTCIIIEPLGPGGERCFPRKVRERIHVLQKNVRENLYFLGKSQGIFVKKPVYALL